MSSHVIKELKAPFHFRVQNLHMQNIKECAILPGYYTAMRALFSVHAVRKTSKCIRIQRQQKNAYLMGQPIISSLYLPEWLNGFGVRLLIPVSRILSRPWRLYF